MNRHDVHIIRKGGMNLVLDVNSGSLHLFDSRSTQVLEALLDGKPAGDFRDEADLEALQEILSLRDAGRLGTPDDGALPRNINYSLKSLCLNVAHVCNLACPYCFASGGNYKGAEAIMTPEVGKRAIDRLLADSHGRKLVEVDFFGGEPLLNLPLIQELIPYGEEKAWEAGKAIKWSMTTNGLLLDEETGRYLAEHQVGTVLSIDGRKEVHDANRYTKSGEGSYDRVVRNYISFKNISEDYVARGTYTGKNLDFFEDVDALRDLGFRHLSMEPVIGGDITWEDLPAIRAAYEELGRRYLEWYREGDPLDFFHFNIQLQGGPCIYKRITACGAGTEYLAITPSGDIYPCHQLIENPEYRLGNIMEEGIREDISRDFQEASIYSKDSCRSCWARFYCSGGCHANNIHYGEGLLSPYALSCEITKIRLEEALYVQAVKLLEGLEAQNPATSDFITKNKIREMLK